jgi:hypothetical protein
MTFFRAYFTVNTSGTVVVYCQNISTGGQVWFDDVSLYPFNGAIYTGLAASTGYYLYPYIEASSGLIKFTNGNPPGTSPSDTLALQCNLDGRIACPPTKITTPASGGSGGTTGGGSGTCPEYDAPVNVTQTPEN